jgi:hypothetical protein
VIIQLALPQGTHDRVKNLCTQLGFEQTPEDLGFLYDYFACVALAHTDNLESLREQIVPLLRRNNVRPSQRA